MTPEFRRQLENFLCGGGNSKAWKFAQSLVKIILADHPADEDEPVTEAWLISIGFVRHETGVGCWNIYLDGMNFCGHRKQWAWPTVGPWKNGPRTRGEVRRICAALGIQLKENKHEQQSES